MIKLEITDLETASEDVLRETGRYLLALSNRAHADVEPVEPPPAPVEPFTEEQIEIHRKVDRQFLDNIVNTCFPLAKDRIAPAPEPVKIPPIPNMCGEVNTDIVPMPSEIFSKPAPIAPAPVPPAPVTPVAPAPSVDLDVHGMPWDIRIHARTKTKMKDGSWKKLRGVGPLVVKTVEAQLLTIQNIPAPPAVPPAPEAPAEAAAPGFSDLMTLVTKAITEGKLKRDQVTAVLKPFGIPSLPLIATRLDLIPAVIEALTEIVNAPF